VTGIIFFSFIELLSLKKFMEGAEKINPKDRQVTARGKGFFALGSKGRKNYCFK